MKPLLWNHRHLVGLATAFVALLAGLLPAASGCTSTETGETCVGGVERAGSCEPRCDPAKCIADNVCVDNRCALLCDSHVDCWAGVQDCTAATTDDGEPVQVCLANGSEPAYTTGPLGGYGVVCPFGDEQCTAMACPNGLECDLGACGGAWAECERDEAACGDDDTCNIGTCKNWDKADSCDTGAGTCKVSGRPCSTDLNCKRCTVTSCAEAQCTALVCVGVADDGNAEAYCSHNDCSADADCPSGYYCGITRDPHDICGPTCSGTSCSDDDSPCSKDGDCQKGNNNFCGKTLDPCLDLPAAQAEGKQYSEGSICLLRSTCLKRDECSPCASNLDCSLGGGDVCFNHGGDDVCARFCAGAEDCRLDEVCVLYGTTCLASPRHDCTVPQDCPLVGGQIDACVDRSVCVPASGSCRAKNAQGNPYCHHCVDDADCGPVDSTWACAEAAEGESACLDLAFPDPCTTDNDCPKSPGGSSGECLDEEEGVGPTDSVYHRCYYPFNDARERFSCW